MRTERGELPGYEVAEVLGRGGFATVYRARQPAVGREVALKTDSRVLATARDRQRIMREVTAAGPVSGHPNVVAVYDAGVLADGRPSMVFELCPVRPVRPDERELPSAASPRSPGSRRPARSSGTGRDRLGRGWAGPKPDPLETRPKRKDDHALAEQ